MVDERLPKNKVIVTPKRFERFNAIITPKNKDSGMLSRRVPIKIVDEELPF